MPFALRAKRQPIRDVNGVGTSLLHWILAALGGYQLPIWIKKLADNLTDRNVLCEVKGSRQR